MKTLVTTFLLIAATLTTAAQNTIIVDNNPNGIGQYTTLSAAITAAQPGDIIMLIPSITSYGDLNMTGTGKRLTIAGGGYNGPAGRVTMMGNISLNGGSAANTNLDGFVIGGVSVGSIDVNFVDNVKIKAVKTSDVIASTTIDLRVRNSVNPEVEYVTTRGVNFTGNTGLKVFHLQSSPGSGASFEIATTTNFIISNSIISSGSGTTGTLISTDAGSTGMWQNNVILLNTGYQRLSNFGGAVTLTNNILIYAVGHQSWPAQPLTGGQTWQNNTFWVTYGGYSSYLGFPSAVGPFGSNSTDANNNAFHDPNFRNISDDKSSLYFRLADNSPSRDSGSGNDVDGTQADRGIFGGLDPMPETVPSAAIGASVVPTVTSLNLSLPTAVTGGQIILKATGQAKKN
jgi:hypothetical protein